MAGIRTRLPDSQSGSKTSLHNHTVLASRFELELSDSKSDVLAITLCQNESRIRESNPTLPLTRRLHRHTMFNRHCGKGWDRTNGHQFFRLALYH